MSDKTAIVVLSDPEGGEEALGRVFNALAAAHDFRRADHEVAVVFQGAGTRWAERLLDPAHPAHSLYESVSESVVGASSACADAFGARASVEASGLALITTNELPGTSGLPSLAGYVRDGYTVLTF